MGKGYLIDSNAIIDFFNKSLPKGGKKLLFSIEPRISIVTYVEIFSKNRGDSPEIGGLAKFSELAKIYDIDKDIASVTIRLRRKHNIKLPDALIAATALFYDLILITRNVSDFGKIDGLHIINPHKY